MRSHAWLAVASLALFATRPAEAAPRKIPAPDPARGAIGITLEYDVKILHNHLAALEVYFVPVREDADRLAGESFVPTNFNVPNQRQSFLLNAPPGRYVVVAALMPSPNGRSLPFKAFLSAEMIPLSEVTVTAGGLAFAGEYLVTTSGRFEDADAAQAHYFPLIAPRAAQQATPFGQRLTGEAPYRASLATERRDAVRERVFWNAARTLVFKNHPDWLEVIGRRLKELASPPAAAGN